jgi:hypothetical protein
MSLIYLVVSSGGEYEDRWHHNEAATHDLDKAKSEVKRLEEEQVAYNLLVDQIAEHSGNFYKQHPIEYKQTMDVPRWPAGIAQTSITPQTRSERDWIKKQNEEAIQRNRKKNKEREDALRAELEVNFPGHTNMFGYIVHSESSFDIEEVPLI